VILHKKLRRGNGIAVAALRGVEVRVVHEQPSTSSGDGVVGPDGVLENTHKLIDRLDPSVKSAAAVAAGEEVVGKGVACISHLSIPYYLILKRKQEKQHQYDDVQSRMKQHHLAFRCCPLFGGMGGLFVYEYVYVCVFVKEGDREAGCVLVETKRERAQKALVFFNPCPCQTGKFPLKQSMNRTTQSAKPFSVRTRRPTKQRRKKVRKQTHLQEQCPQH
jgi:hypothetical protein